MTPKEICKLLDHQARADLRQVCDRGFINRSHRKRRGVNLLLVLELIEKTKTHKTMYRYEPTEKGREVADFLPTRENEWFHIMEKSSLIYADGTEMSYEDVPRYIRIADYQAIIRQFKSDVRKN